MFKTALEVRASTLMASVKTLSDTYKQLLYVLTSNDKGDTYYVHECELSPTPTASTPLPPISRDSPVLSNLSQPPPPTPAPIPKLKMLEDCKLVTTLHMCIYKMCSDSNGNLYFLLNYDNCIYWIPSLAHANVPISRKCFTDLSSSSTTTTDRESKHTDNPRSLPLAQASIFAGARTTSNFVDGRVSRARFSVPRHITCDINGCIVVCDNGNSAIRFIDVKNKYNPRKTKRMARVTTLARDLKHLAGVVVDGNNCIYFVDSTSWLRRLKVGALPDEHEYVHDLGSYSGNSDFSKISSATYSGVDYTLAMDRNAGVLYYSTQEKIYGLRLSDKYVMSLVPEPRNSFDALYNAFERYPKLAFVPETETKCSGCEKCNAKNFASSYSSSSSSSSVSSCNDSCREYFSPKLLIQYTHRIHYISLESRKEILKYMMAASFHLAAFPPGLLMIAVSYIVI